MQCKILTAVLEQKVWIKNKKTPNFETSIWCIPLWRNSWVKEWEDFLSNGESSSPGFFFLQFCDRCQKSGEFFQKVSKFCQIYSGQKKNISRCVLSKINNKNYPPKKITGTPHPSLNVCVLDQLCNLWGALNLVRIPKVCSKASKHWVLS